MEHASVAAVFRALNESSVRYLVVGGFAVVAHGHTRFTADIDLVLAMDLSNLERAVDAFSRLGYQPRAPVPIRDFCDEVRRAQWIAEKRLVVFSLWSPSHPLTDIDLFVASPFRNFDDVYGRALRAEVAPGVTATFVGKSDLIKMKRDAGRRKDLEDLRDLSDGSEDDER
jgi:hypothetical protein